MTNQIEQAMAADIEQLTWMSPETKQNALAKLHSISNKIGYPDKWRDYQFDHDRTQRLRGKR